MSVIEFWNEPFDTIMSQIEGSLVDRIRCFILHNLLRQTRTLPGDIAEIGVYKGGTAKVIALTSKDYGKKIHLFDTFKGMPPSSKHDIHYEGNFGDCPLEEVKNYLRNFDNVYLYKGIFPKDTGHQISDLTFSFVHVDVDIYPSVLDCCNFFYTRMVPGGIILFDDYGHDSCPGAKIAIDEFFIDKREYPCILTTGQCFMVKI